MVKEALGIKAVFLPYCRPGLPLAKAALGAYERNPQAEAWSWRARNFHARRRGADGL